MKLFKVITEENWRKSQDQGHIFLSPLDAAFIHFAQQDEVDRIVKKYFPYEVSVIVVEVDSTLLPRNLVK